MTEETQVTLVLHGLDTDNKLVRARVFATKLTAFLSGLAAADKLANGKRVHEFVIAELAIGSAVVKIREKQKTRERPRFSSVGAYANALSSIYKGDRSASELPAPLLAAVTRLSNGADAEFAHGEVLFTQSDPIRIDDYLHRQSEKTREASRGTSAQTEERFYRGLARGSFDGVLRLMDGRGEMLRIKLVTTAGGVELDCVASQTQVPRIRELFNERVRVEGVAHYDGEQQLPVRIDINLIHEIKRRPDLVKWRGAVAFDTVASEDW